MPVHCRREEAAANTAIGVRVLLKIYSFEREPPLGPCSHGIAMLSTGHHGSGFGGISLVDVPACSRDGLSASAGACMAYGGGVCGMCMVLQHQYIYNGHARKSRIYARRRSTLLRQAMRC